MKRINAQEMYDICETEISQYGDAYQEIYLNIRLSKTIEDIDTLLKHALDTELVLVNKITEFKQVFGVDYEYALEHQEEMIKKTSGVISIAFIGIENTKEHLKVCYESIDYQFDKLDAYNALKKDMNKRELAYAV